MARAIAGTSSRSFLQQALGRSRVTCGAQDEIDGSPVEIVGPRGGPTAHQNSMRPLS
jgi:hypothetical protein